MTHSAPSRRVARRTSFLVRLGVVCIPSLAAMALGCLASSHGQTWQAIAYGGALSLPLSLLGAIAIILTCERSVILGMAGACFSVLVRLSGCALVLACFKHHPQAPTIVSSLILCLTLTVLMELLAAVRVPRSLPAFRDGAHA